MRKTFAFMMAAALLAGTMQMAMAEDASSGQDDARIAYGRGGRHHGRFGDRRGDFRRGPGGPGRFEGCPRFDGPRDQRGPGNRGEGWGMGHRGPGRRGMGTGMGEGMGMRFGRAFDQLDLTADQKAGLLDVMTANFRARTEARMELRDAELALRDVRNDASASADALVQANAKVGAARGKMDVVRRQAREDVEKILTPEQLKKMEDWRMGPPASAGENDEWRPGPGPRGFGHRGGRMTGPGPRRY